MTTVEDLMQRDLKMIDEDPTRHGSSAESTILVCGDVGEHSSSTLPITRGRSMVTVRRNAPSAWRQAISSM